MATFCDFLGKYPDLISSIQHSFSIPSDDSEITLTGVLISIKGPGKDPVNDLGGIFFLHLGQCFYISENDIIDIEKSEDVLNIFKKEKGMPVTIRLNANANLELYGVITAPGLYPGSNDPYPIARESQIPEIYHTKLTAKELAWFAKNGIDTRAAPNAAASVTCTCSPAGRRPCADDIFR